MLHWREIMQLPTMAERRAAQAANRREFFAELEAKIVDRPVQTVLDLDPGDCGTCDGDRVIDCETCAGAGCDDCDDTGERACPECAAARWGIECQ